MKDNLTPEILAACLAELEARRLTIEECLEAYPEAAEELRPLLEVACKIPPLPSVMPDPAFRARARANLIASIMTGEESVTNSPLLRFWKQVSGGWVQPPQLIGRRMGMPALIIIVVMALTTVTGGGAVYASQDTLPGDALYQVKTAVEGLQVSLAAGDEAKAGAYLDLAAKRLAEIQKASKAGNTSATNTAAETLAVQLTQVNQHLDGATASGKNVSDVADQLREILERQQLMLAAIDEGAPEKAKTAPANPIVKAAQGLAKAIDRAENESNSKKDGKGEINPTPTITATVQPTATVAAVTPTVTPTATTGISSTVSITFTQILSNVSNLANDPNVSGKSYNGLLAKLRAAENALDRGQNDVAVNVLNAFVNELNAFKAAGHISVANYNSLYASYTALVNSLGGTPKSETTPAKPQNQTQSDQDEDNSPTDTERNRGKGNENSKKFTPTPDSPLDPALVSPTVTPTPSKDNSRQAPSKGRQ